MFSTFTKIISNFTASPSPAGAPDAAAQPTPSKLSADSPPFVPTASGLEPPSFALDGPAAVDDAAYAGEFEGEFEPQSACIDAEIQIEMDECLNAILQAQCVGMNYSAAAKAMTGTISKRAQRLNVLRQHRERSRDEVDANDDVGQTDAAAGGDDHSASEEQDENDEPDDDARAATKSFGTTKVANYYRTKPERDAARLQHASEVLKRSGRHPSHRNVAMQAHRLAPDQKKIGLRGGRSAHVAQEQ